MKSSHEVPMLNAALMPKPILHLVRLGGTGYVHSIYEHVFNIIIHGKLIGIGSAEMPPNPMLIIVKFPPHESILQLGIQQGLPVHFMQDCIQIDHILRIALNEARIWSPKIQCEFPQDPKQIQLRLVLVKNQLANLALNMGLGNPIIYLDAILRGKSNQLLNLRNPERELVIKISRFIEALRSRDLDHVKSTSRQLIGLGSGLTPSGDDLLAGFMIAFWWISKIVARDTTRASELNRAIVSCCEHTTLLSQQILRYAARGEADQRILALLESILVTGYELKSRLREVLMIGSSSGLYLALGIILGLELGLELLSSL